LWPVLKMMNLEMKAYNQAKKAISKVMKVFNNHLATNTYFVGHQPTIADAAIFCALLDMYSTVFAPGYIRGFGNVTRWFNTVARHPAFAGVVGEVTFATSEKKAEMPKKKQKQPKQQKKNSKAAKGAKKTSLSDKMSQITNRAPPPSKPEKLSKEDEKDLESVTKKGYCHFRSDKDSASRDIIGDIRPKKIGSGSPAPALPKAQSHTSAVVGSDWNSAGTWEEKDKSKQATARLKELLKGLSWGAAEITKLSKVEGTASFNLSRKGKFFVFEYRLEMEAKVAHSSGSDRTFKLTFPDVSSVVLDDKDDDFEMDVSVKSGKKDAECLSALEALKFHVDQAINTFANEFIAQLK